MNAVAPGVASTAFGPSRILLTVCAAMVFIVFHATGVNVALPTIGRDLGVEPGLLGWVVTAFLLVYGVAIPLYGRLADLHGARRFFMLGQALFAVGSLLCAVAPTFPLLLVARAIQAAGGAAVAGLAFALAAGAFPPDRRGAALGILGTTIGVAGMAGPVLGGFLAGAFGWQAIFVVTALSGLVVPASWAALPRDRGRGGSRLDVAGGLFLGLTVGGALLVAAEGTRAGWGAPQVTWGAAMAALGLVGLVVRQRTAASPFVPRDLLESHRYVVLVATSFAAVAVSSGALVGTPLLLTGINGLPPVQIGLVMLPGAVLSAALAAPIGWLVDRLGARTPIRVGLTALPAAVLGLSTAVGTPAWVLAALLGLLGVGVAFLTMPLATAISLLVRPERLPSAQSINAMLLSLGGSLGATLATSVVAAQQEVADGLNPLHAGPGAAFSDAFLVLAVLPVGALALSAAIPGGKPSVEPGLATSVGAPPHRSAEGARAGRSGSTATKELTRGSET